MKVLRCPLNGDRNISEFTYGGEYRAQPNADNCNDREWAEHVFFPDNKAGVVTEWWCHTASCYWFLAERDSRTDQILRTFDAPKPADGETRT